MVTTAEIEERNSAIADIFIEEFDAPLQILTANEDENGVIFGNLISSGEFFTYAFDDESIGVVHHEAETQELNEYAHGLLGGYGIKTDSDSPYEYTFGLLRTDAQVRCTKGGTPCGKVCLPKGAVCRKYGGGGSASGSKLRSGGGAAVAGGIAGGVAAAATAGAVGGLAYLNRKNLAMGGKAVGERLKRAGTEGYAEAEQGVTAAKKTLKEGFKAAKKVENFSNKLASEVSSDPEYSQINSKDRRNFESKGTIAKEALVGSMRGAAIGGAVGATSAGIKNASKAVGRNLKEAGKDVATTAKNSANTTKRAAESIKERFFPKKNNPKISVSSAVPDPEVNPLIDEKIIKKKRPKSSNKK